MADAALDLALAVRDLADLEEEGKESARNFKGSNRAPA
jgi:hypothetical protein